MNTPHDELQDLQREVELLQGCEHPHLLPLLGHCLVKESPCLVSRRNSNRGAETFLPRHCVSPRLPNPFRRCETAASSSISSHPTPPLYPNPLRKVFPLMKGSSLQCRLQPTSEDEIYLRQLGFLSADLSTGPRRLTWRQRLHIVKQATEALVYLHTPTASKACIVHRDFKPVSMVVERLYVMWFGGPQACTGQDVEDVARMYSEWQANILLDENLNACLADTGFAKIAQQEGQATVTTRNGPCYSLGYVPPAARCS